MPEQEPHSIPEVARAEARAGRRLMFLRRSEIKWLRRLSRVWHLLAIVIAAMLPILSVAEIWLTQVPHYRLQMDEIKWEESRDHLRNTPFDDQLLAEHSAKLNAMREEEKILSEEIDLLEKTANEADRPGQVNSAHFRTGGCSDLGPLMNRQSDLIKNLTSH